METFEIIFVVGSIILAGFGVGVAALSLGAFVSSSREVRMLSRGREEAAKTTSTVVESAEESATHPPNRGRAQVRDSEVIGLRNNASSIRQKDGSYAAAFEYTLQPTLYAKESDIESRCDRLGAFLAMEKPPGTVLQFRFSSAPDPGEWLRSLTESQEAGAHTGAQLLQTLQAEFMYDKAAGGEYATRRATLWVRVPKRGAKKGKSGGSTQPLGATLRLAWRRGRREPSMRRAFSAFISAMEASRADGVLRRILAEEDAETTSAEKHFRSIENSFPIPMRRLRGEELSRALFFGHNMAAKTAPRLPQREGRDLRPYLCGESIDGDSDFLLHGNVPVAMISVFGLSSLTADVMRMVTTRSDLSHIRHTVITEYVYPDQAKELSRLAKRRAQIERFSRLNLSGTAKLQSDTAAAIKDLNDVTDQVFQERVRLLRVRVYVLIYGNMVRTEAELQRERVALDDNCEKMIAAFQGIEGCDARREEPEDLRALYARSLVGELSREPTGREFVEVATSVAALIPAEGAWRGCPRPHSVVKNVTGALIGIDFLDRNTFPSPLISFFAGPGGGKSNAAASFIKDFLGKYKGARGSALDFGESIGPLAQSLGGRLIRLDPRSPLTLGVWDYPGLEVGHLPDAVQKTFVTEDIKLQARVREDDAIAEAVIAKVVDITYRNIVPENGSGNPKYEPRLSHFLANLEAYQFDNDAMRESRDRILFTLEQYRGNPFLDAPTSEVFAHESLLDVYELDALDDFAPDVRRSLAFRCAVRVWNSDGQKLADGTRTPCFLFFDEMHRYTKDYAAIRSVLEKGARQGRKENVITLIASQAFEDIAEDESLVSTNGVRFIGKQEADFPLLTKKLKLTPAAQNAIFNIQNVAGEYAQFVMIVGSGPNQIVEHLQLEYAPVVYWHQTTNPDERNARARVSYLTGWTDQEVIVFLAAHYPRGLTAAGLTRIDESLIQRAYAAA